MRAWHRKACIDGVKALVPFRASLRRIARELKPYETNPQNDMGLLGDSLRQVYALKRSGARIEGARVVEIGTGWNPIVPIVFRLCGAARVITVDQDRLLDLRQFRKALAYIKAHAAAAAQRLNIPLEFDFSRVTGDGDDLDDALDDAGIDYRAPYDFTDMEPDAADIVVSRDVLEHIPEDALRAILKHCRHVLSDGGFLCHIIDMSDHWEHGDKSISRVNFLQYEGLGWRLAGLNAQNFQNRLRRFEYVQIMRDGFRILQVTGQPDPAALRALPALRVCPRYAAVPHRELAVLNTTVVAQMC